MVGFSMLKSPVVVLHFASVESIICGQMFVMVLRQNDLLSMSECRYPLGSVSGVGRRVGTGDPEPSMGMLSGFSGQDLRPR
jgi:hypothetical protein